MTERWLAVCSVALLVGAVSTALGADAPPVRVLIVTALGEIEVELDAAHAPVTTTNFLRYVDGHFYDGGRFHRAVKPDNQPDNKIKIEVIQVGIDLARAKD